LKNSNSSTYDSENRNDNKNEKEKIIEIELLQNKINNMHIEYLDLRNKYDLKSCEITTLKDTLDDYKKP